MGRRPIGQVRVRVEIERALDDGASIRDIMDMLSIPYEMVYRVRHEREMARYRLRRDAGR